MMSKDQKKNKRKDIIDQLVCQNFAKLRKYHDITQREVAEATGVSIQQVQKYENGVNRISSGKLYIIAELLKIPLHYFYLNLENYMPGHKESESLISKPIIGEG